MCPNSLPFSLPYLLVEGEWGDIEIRRVLVVRNLVRNLAFMGWFYAASLILFCFYSFFYSSFLLFFFSKNQSKMLVFFLDFYCEYLLYHLIWIFLKQLNSSGLGKKTKTKTHPLPSFPFLSSPLFLNCKQARICLEALSSCSYFWVFLQALGSWRFLLNSFMLINFLILTLCFSASLGRASGLECDFCCYCNMWNAIWKCDSGCRIFDSNSTASGASAFLFPSVPAMFKSDLLLWWTAAYHPNGGNFQWLKDLRGYAFKVPTCRGAGKLCSAPIGTFAWAAAGVFDTEFLWAWQRATGPWASWLGWGAPLSRVDPARGGPGLGKGCSQQVEASVPAV